MRFELIVGFVNPNITEKVIKTAKNAGATGDVIIQGKGTGIEPSNFLGLSIQDKTDIILFVVEEHHTNKIIESISKDCNIESPGNGILLVLNIDRVIGLSSQIKKIRENLNSEQL
jgi:nitrogen regulatory protein PII